MEQLPVQLTQTQINMLALSAQGYSREDIGRELFLSPWTVKDYLDAARGLLQARNVTHAVAICIFASLIKIDDETGSVSAIDLQLLQVA